MAKGRRGQSGKQRARAFYEAGMPAATGETALSGGGESAETALREPQDERLEPELRRWFRELMLRQPDDVGLVMRSSRVLMRTKGSRAEEARRQMEAVLEGLGDQLLPRDG